MMLVEAVLVFAVTQLALTTAFIAIREATRIR